MKKAIIFSRTTLLIVWLAGACFGSAQSGRHPTKAPPPPVATVESPAVEPSASNKPAEKPKAAVSLIVGMDRSDYGNTARATNVGGVLATVYARLKQNASVGLELLQRPLNYAEAHGRATTEKEAHVVFLQVRTDTMTMGSNNPRPSLNYWVFSPGTAKIKTRGTTYPQVYRNRGIIVNPKAPAIYTDQQLHQAAVEAAERILDSFKLD